MSNQSPSSQPRKVLGIGNVISASLRIYKDNFKSYLGISFKASLWLIYPFLAIPVLGIIIAILSFVVRGNGLIIGLLIFISVIFWFYFICYCAGKSLTYSALISKLAYQILINQPDSVSATFEKINSKHWLFWRTSLLVGIYLWLISLGLNLIQSFLFDLTKSINNSFFNIFWILIVILLCLTAYSWFVARFFIPELPIVIENCNQATLAINRSWQLTKGYANKILIIISVAFLITIPVYLLAMTPLVIGLFPLIPVILTSYALQNLDALPKVMEIVSLSILASIIIFIFLNIAALPFWQTIKAVIYYDIVTRKEGVGFNLNDS